MNLVSRKGAPNQERSGVRLRTFDDLLTYDRAMRTNENGDQMGKPFGFRCQTSDGRTYDSSGAFLVGELERLDPTIHEPLVEVSWQRDIDLRTDVTIADEVSSYTTSTFGSPGGLGVGNSVGNGKAWMGKNTSEIPGVSLDIAKTPGPLRPWALELKYDILELESAARVGRPIDVQKFDAIRQKHQMDIDEQVYYGDTSTGDKGLVNAGAVTPTNLPAGASGYTTWANKSADEILADVNYALTTNWTNAAWAVMPTRVLIPPVQFGQIVTQKVSQAGNVSVKRYLEENNLVSQQSGAKLEIFPLKWSVGAGAGGTIGTANGHDRMVVYAKEYNRVRYPMTNLQRTPIQYNGMYHQTEYYCRLGVLEVVYPQTVGYYDGL